MDVEKTIEFLLQNQARHDATLAKHQDLIGSLAGVVRDLALQVDRISDAQAHTDRIVLQLTGTMKELAEGQKKLAEAQLRTEEKIARLAEGQGDTTEKLNALLRVVDGMIRGNGKQ